MDVEQGPSVDDRLRASGPLPPAEVARIGLRVLDLLRPAHQAGQVHGAISPRTVLLPGDRLIQGAPDPLFMSPEQAQGLPLTPASDLWSLGATLYAAVEGRTPYADPAAIPTADPFPPVRAQALTPALHALLRRNPAERPTLDQLQAMLRPRGNRRLVAVLAAALAGLVVVAIVVVLVVRPFGGSGNATTYRGTLHSPMRLQPVQAEHPAPCATGESPSLDGKLCYSLGQGFTVTDVQTLHIQRQGPAGPVLQVTLRSADAARFAALSRQAYTAYQQDPNAPARQIAVLVKDQVVMAPEISEPITGGSFDIRTAPTDTTGLTRLWRQLTGH